MTSKEISELGFDCDGRDWLREIAYQLARLNEPGGLGDQSRPEDMICSFCGQRHPSQSSNVLIKYRSIAICEACVRTCNELIKQKSLEKEDQPEKSEAEPPSIYESVDDTPPTSQSMYRHPFIAVPTSRFCGECDGGRNHPVHIGGTHARQTREEPELLTETQSEK